MKSKSEKEKIELKKRLARILRVNANKVCADCPETRPTWISFIKPQQNFALGSQLLASFVCLECAGLHRKLGTHICVVRSISHDQFDNEDVDCAEYSGNEVVNEIFEGHLQKSTIDDVNIKPLLGAEVDRRERFIRQKYVDLYFYRKRAHYQHIAEVNKIISDSRKSSKAPDGGKSSPTKPFRKKLSIFMNDQVNKKDGAECSTTVGNTTETPSNTSRTRTLTDRDDSNKSDSYKRRDKKRSKKRTSSKKQGNFKNRKKTEKKSKQPPDYLPEEGNATIEGKSVPLNQQNENKDLKSRNQTHRDSRRRFSKDNDELSGMILVFDDDSSELIQSPKRERRKSSRSRKKLSGSEKPTVDAYESNEEAKVRHKKRSGTRKSKAKLAAREDSSQPNTPIMPETSLVQNISDGNLLIPYLEPSSVSLKSVEGIVSEETSYGFGDNTISNMSGTGVKNPTSNNEDQSTDDGFRVIDSQVLGNRNSRGKGVLLGDGASFSQPLKNKKAIDGAIKNQSGRRYSFDNHDMHLSSSSFGNMSNRSISMKSNTSISMKSIISNGVDALSMRRNKQWINNFSVHGTHDELQWKVDQFTARKKKMSRSTSRQSKKNLNTRNQALLDEWKRLTSENEKKLVEFKSNFANFHEPF